MPAPGLSWVSLHYVSWGRLAPSLGLITDPFLTALSPDFNPAWCLAPHPGRLGLSAQRHTADGTVHTHTLVFTARLEALPITVDHTIMLAACSHHICTHSFFVPRHVRAVVTVQSLVVVACVCLVTHLAHLPGAGLAAVTAVHEEAHTWRTGRGDLGTLTGPLAILRPVVWVHSCGHDGCGRRHGSGILGVGLLNPDCSYNPQQEPTHHW